eukprot:4949811-Prymnesium_polylepis.1
MSLDLLRAAACDAPVRLLHQFSSGSTPQHASVQLAPRVASRGTAHVCASRGEACGFRFFCDHFVGDD